MASFSWNDVYFIIFFLKLKQLMHKDKLGNGNRQSSECGGNSIPKFKETKGLGLNNNKNFLLRICVLFPYEQNIGLIIYNQKI